MKPVHQTIIDPEEGNCLMACLASLFECGIEDIPHIPPKGGRQMQELRRWLEPMGLTVVLIDVSGPKSHYTAARLPIGMLMMVSGPSLTFPDACHVVVGRMKNEIGEWEMVHDPNPSSKGLSKAYYYYFVVPTDPSQLRGFITNPKERQI